ncbi:hypothetical protein LSH36_41g10012 [Paralvinella palmiformis]|uniref:Uncharacterized protein n=1 Tax=Paralvinella palmiformis TaxID=53620 RepID=A0AAD9K8V7_9ANNE|nr:hypothetical protein LSH36_41g10012 [Paralvinella palmiformis]
MTLVPSPWTPSPCTMPLWPDADPVGCSFLHHSDSESLLVFRMADNIRTLTRTLGFILNPIPSRRLCSTLQRHPAELSNDITIVGEFYLFWEVTPVGHTAEGRLPGEMNSTNAARLFGGRAVFRPIPVFREAIFPPTGAALRCHMHSSDRSADESGLKASVINERTELIIRYDAIVAGYSDILLYKNKFELDFLPIQADGGLEISKSLSQMENHPQFSGMTPGIPLVQLHPKPWCTATSTIHREHLGRGTARTNPVHGYSEQDKSSDHSGDGSLTDSGKGPSEEGEMKHRLPHSLGGHYGTHGHVKLPNARREGHFSCQPGTRTLPLRMSNESYPPPPPPPPNRLRTFNPDGQIVRSPNQSPSSVVYPSGMEPYGTLNKANVKQDTLGSLHRNIDESTNSRKPSDPWHGQGAVIGESVIV